MPKSIANSIIICLLIISLSIAYYLVIFIPKKEQYKYEQEKFEIEKAKEDEQIRLLQREKTFEYCDEYAAKQASELLIEKSELTNDSMYKKASEKGLYLKDDYQNYYDRCLEKYDLK